MQVYALKNKTVFKKQHAAYLASQGHLQIKVLTLMNSEVVSDTVTCAMAVVQAHLPQCPATQHLHVHTC